MKHQATSQSSPMVQPSSMDAVDTATLELLSKWKQEDATKSPEEVRAAGWRPSCGHILVKKDAQPLTQKLSILTF